METKKTNFWWMKTPEKATAVKDSLVPQLNLEGLSESASFTDILQKSDAIDPEVDVESIIEEINRVAAQSPLGPFERRVGERSIDDIMKETEKIFMESSKSFEQLSQRSKTSQNISDIMSSNSKMSTPTPKSISPLPLDPSEKTEYHSDYSEDFSEDSKDESEKSCKGSSNIEQQTENVDQQNVEISSGSKSSSSGNDGHSSQNSQSKAVKSVNLVKNIFKMPIAVAACTSPNSFHANTESTSNKGSRQSFILPATPKLTCEKMPLTTPELPDEPAFGRLQGNKGISELSQEIEIRNKLIKTLEDDNALLRTDIISLKRDLQDTHALIENLRSELNVKVLRSPEVNLELDKALEELKDSKEINTALQLQLDTVNKSHQLLRGSYDELISANKNLERKVVELDSTLTKYRTELFSLQQTKNKLLENEANLNKLLEIEKLQSKGLKLQTDKDSKCIQDLNRQIKEMERIIARKHPDSVSALIVAAKQDADNHNLTTRKLLEDRIKMLEQEVNNRDSQSSKVFLEIQEKFNQMKNKYESHIEDLELHVTDLKNQLKKKTDTYDVYTQTFFDKKIPQKETFTIAVQTETVATNKIKTAAAAKKDNHKEDAHLVATIRGLQTDLANKEKVVLKLQKEIDEMKKTNRRLQKEREGSLRNLSDRKEFRSYPEKLSSNSRSESVQDVRKDEELQQLKSEKDRLKLQLARLEGDYQNLKKKRLDDLTALQEAHEREVGNYVSSVTPLREQLELHQVTIGTLQTQLTKAKEELAVLTVERDHLNERLLSNLQLGGGAIIVDNGGGDGREVETLQKKIHFLEKTYEERECRLRAIVQSLAQKSVTNRSCEQCAERQQQLIGYKIELDQLLASVRALK